MRPCCGWRRSTWARFTERLWKGEDAPTAVLASATIPPHLGERLGLSAGSYDEIWTWAALFPTRTRRCFIALCTCPTRGRPISKLPCTKNWSRLSRRPRAGHLRCSPAGGPCKRPPKWSAGVTPWKIFTQSDLPKPKLVAEFTSDEHSCLFATMGFWQGVDVPGPSLSLVTIDRIPFPRPDDPLLRARRAALVRRAFELIDVPRAATLLAQGVGRLVRSREDRGVVAVLDRRLGKARYRWQLVHALPPMRRTRSRAEVDMFLKSLGPGSCHE